MKSKNNQSRNMFKEFVSKYGLQSNKVDNRNAVLLNGNLIGFSVFSGNQIECRQFYEDYDKLLAVEENTGKIFMVAREDLKVDFSPNRIQPSTGKKAYQASCQDKSKCLTTFTI